MIHDFRQLQELELAVSWQFNHQGLFSSISSTELRKVVFLVWLEFDWRIFGLQIEVWDLIDKEMCGVVDRLCTMGYRHTLEAEVRLTRVGGGGAFIDFFPGFREKGIVTIIDAT